MIEPSNPGEQRRSVSLLWPIEQKLIRRIVPKVPRYLNGYNLTLLNILWSVGVLVVYWFARQNLGLLWCASGILVLQYCTDSLDGAIGRYRKSGLARWGYYMDHFLDYLFWGSVFLGLALLVPRGITLVLFAAFIVAAGFMVHSYLQVFLTREFQLSLSIVGPTELRLLAIGVNTLIIFFGLSILTFAATALLVVALLTLIVLVYRTQHRLKRMDDEARPVVDS